MTVDIESHLYIVGTPLGKSAIQHIAEIVSDALFNRKVSRCVRNGYGLNNVIFKNQPY